MALCQFSFTPCSFRKQPFIDRLHPTKGIASSFFDLLFFYSSTLILSTLLFYSTLLLFYFILLFYSSSVSKERTSFYTAAVKRRCGSTSVRLAGLRSRMTPQKSSTDSLPSRPSRHRRRPPSSTVVHHRPRCPCVVFDLSASWCPYLDSASDNEENDEETDEETARLDAEEMWRCKRSVQLNLGK